MLVILGNSGPADWTENGHPPASFTPDSAATGFKVEVAVADGKEFSQPDTAVQEQGYDCQVPRSGEAFKPFTLIQKPKQLAQFFLVNQLNDFILLVLVCEFDAAVNGTALYILPVPAS
jgi:hypothetical protein